MDPESAQTSPPCRWWHSLKLRYIAALLALAVGACWLHDALFVPEDLRRMQGTWRVMRRHTPEFEMNVDPNERWTIRGPWLSTTADANESDRIVLQNGRFCWFSPQDNERTILGFTFCAPLWLDTPSRGTTGDYQFVDGQLILGIKGIFAVNDDLHAQRVTRTKVYLERQ